MFSKPTTQPGVYGTTPNPYIANNSMAPGSQQPLSFIIPRNQPQSGQPPFITSPEIRTNNQQGQGNVLMVNPATVTATTNFKEEGKTLGVSLFTIRILILHLQGFIVLRSYRWREAYDLMTYIQSLKSSECYSGNCIPFR